MRKLSLSLSLQVAELPEVVENLVRGELSWSEVEERWPVFTGQESTQ